MLPDVRDGSLWCGRASVSTAAAGHSCGSLAAWVGTQIARAPGWISAKRVVDSPDDVAVELVGVPSVDRDPHRFSLVLVDLVILLGASGDEP